MPFYGKRVLCTVGRGERIAVFAGVSDNRAMWLRVSVGYADEVWSMGSVKSRCKVQSLSQRLVHGSLEDLHADTSLSLQADSC